MEAVGFAFSVIPLVIQYVDSCATFSSQAQSLSVRFEWDLKALKSAQTYFKKVRPSSAEDEALLQRASHHLHELVSEVRRKLVIILKTSFLSRAALAATWIIRRSDLEELERQLFNWTQRLGVHVIDLPPSMRTAIPTRPLLESSIPPIIKSNERLREFARLAFHDQDVRAEGILLQDPATLSSKITNSRFISDTPLKLEDQQLVFSSRVVPDDITDENKAFETLMSEMGILAAALNCLDPAAEIQLLKVENYFYHEDSNQIIFVHHSPVSTEWMWTLSSRLDSDPFPETRTPLNDRFKLAYKLAEAVLFLHTAEFLHKNITSSSIVEFRQWGDLIESASLGDIYLMGFELIRGAESRTAKQGAKKRAENARSIWEFDVYQHPDRHLGAQSARYVKAYDVYSLGVVLLEIGLWQPLSRAAETLDDSDPSTWAEFLSNLAARSLQSKVGGRYQQAVSWCLALTGESGLKEIDFVKFVLDPLNEILVALS